MTRLWITLAVLSVCTIARSADDRLNIPDDVTRTWVGPQFWANRLQDWRIADGRIECTADQPRLRMRTLHLLTKELNDSDGSFEITVRCGLLNDDPQKVSDSAACGFLIGIAPDNDYRKRAIIHGASGPGAGTFFGAHHLGESFLVDNERPWTGKPINSGKLRSTSPERRPINEIRLQGRPTDNGTYELTLTTTQRLNGVVGGEVVSSTFEYPKERLRGGIALVSHPGDAQKGKKGGRWWFDDLTISGDKFTKHPERALGPIVSTQYTVDVSQGDPALMKMTAQLMPIGESGPQSAALQVQQADDSWKTIDEADLVVPGWTATFRDDEWNPSIEDHFRVVYPSPASVRRQPADESVWSGVIRKDPIDKDTFVVAGFTGNHNNHHGFARPGYDFTKNIWFPHTEITRAVEHHDPDLLFFSGDQVYEGDSPTFADTKPENIKLDYMYKWYLWCWAYRDLTKDTPCIVEPDDHDVYQGNLWGQGGRKAVSPPGDRYDPKPNDHDGGYVHPADFIQMLERTQTSHLPDPYDTEPLEQGITSYYTDLVWGQIGVAILEDRKFKSGCNRPDMPPSGTGRPDHFNDPDFDINQLDVPGLTLLGEKQLEFLNKFAEDWDGQVMKLAVSQTIFANTATHHGRGLMRLRADLDSNGWPQTGRNKAVAALRKGKMFHLAGDQHLATIVHHGIDKHGDAMWSFCVPSVANFYPRAWAPKDGNDYTNPPPEDYTGDFYDGFGHPVTVYAATNPPHKTGEDPVGLHEGMPGYGIVRLNKADKTITMECWPRSSDASDPNAKQYVGWPRTIRMDENGGTE